MCFNKLIDINPKDSEAYYNLGNIYNNQKIYDKANECFKKAKEFTEKELLIK